MNPPRNGKGAFPPSNGPRRAIALAAVAVVAAAGWLAWHFSASEASSPDLSDPVLVAEGAEVYRAHCASCHGANLEGHPDWQRRRPEGGLHPPPHDETGHTWHHADSLLFQITKHGGQRFAPADFQSNMPAFEEILSDREIWASLAYIKSRWTEEIRERQRRLSARSSGPLP